VARQPALRVLGIETDDLDAVDSRISQPARQTAIITASTTSMQAAIGSAA
jgi:hypothetical protein